MIITSPDNAQVKMWEKLRLAKYRDQERLYIIEQPHMIEEAIKGSCLQTLLVRDGVENRFDFPCITVSDSVMKKISSNSSLNDYAGICRYLDKQDPEGNTFIILDSVQDPGNVGTIIRTAYSLGYDAIFMNDRCAGLYNSKTIQSSQGAFFHLPCVIEDTERTIRRLQEKGIRVIGTSLKADRTLQEMPAYERYALLFGNEGRGLDSTTEALCDELTLIEMDRFDSLNVASAMAISGYMMKHK